MYIEASVEWAADASAALLDNSGPVQEISVTLQTTGDSQVRLIGEYPNVKRLLAQALQSIEAAKATGAYTPEPIHTRR